MDINTDGQTTQSISDDQELAKVLAGINMDAPAADVDTTTPAVPTPPTPPPVVDPVPAAPAVDDAMAMSVPAIPVVDNLDTIKQQALGELRPLVDKLNVAPEEKFDTYLLLLRSTDDKALIAPAHEAAVAIADEARKAQALLDIIKEIDYLNQKTA